MLPGDENISSSSSPSSPRCSPSSLPSSPLSLCPLPTACGDVERVVVRLRVFLLLLATVLLLSPSTDDRPPVEAAGGRAGMAGAHASGLRRHWC
jgi:hypothetical protein